MRLLLQGCLTGNVQCPGLLSSTKPRAGKPRGMEEVQVRGSKALWDLILLSPYPQVYLGDSSLLNRRDFPCDPLRWL